MIQIYSNLITKDECADFINFYKLHLNDVVNVFNDNVYHFDGVNLINNLDDFSFFKRLNITSYIVDRVRVQHVDNNTPIIEKFHTDKQPYTFIVFLNENFEGGNLIYSNIEIKPFHTQLIYTSGDELHYVKKVTHGDRYTLVCFLRKELDFNKLKSII